MRENSTIKRMCENREVEIAQLMASNREVEKNNELQIEQNNAFSITVSYQLIFLVKTTQRIKAQKRSIMRKIKQTP